MPGDSADAIRRAFDVADIVKLASNENPYGCSPWALAAAHRALAGVSTYPADAGEELRDALARKFGLPAEQFILGSGSSEILELVPRAFLDQGDEAICAQYSFAGYAIAVRATGATAVEVAARDFGHDLDAMLAAVNHKTRVVYITNPNNPTGSTLDPDKLHAFIDAVPRHILVVLDEAYVEYLPDEVQPASARWVRDFPHLLVTRTFSKAYGLASLRIGYGIGSRSVIDALNRVRRPFNVSAVAQAAAIAALRDAAFVRAARQKSARGRERLVQQLSGLGIDCLPSGANFVAANASTPDISAAEIYRSMLTKGVIVRPLTGYGLPNYLRISVGTTEQIDRCIAALAEARGQVRPQEQVLAAAAP